MKDKTPARTLLLIGFAAGLACCLGCGTGSTLPTTPPHTYLYVGEIATPDPITQTGSIAQFRMESDGTLTELNTSNTGNFFPGFAAVAPVDHYLFVLNGVIGEFGIGSDGVLTAAGEPADGTSIAFAPGEQIAFVANYDRDTLSSFAVSASGALTPINTVTTGSFPTYVAVDGSGKFAYVANGDDDTISEYTISAGGILAPSGSIASGGHYPRYLVVSPGGFLYCGSANLGSVTEFAIDGSTGALTPVNNPVLVAGALWISFDPAGTHAFVGNTGEIFQFTVDARTGALIGNGTTLLSDGANWGGVDPSGKFAFTAGGGTGAATGGTVNQFIVTSTGALIPNGSVALGANVVADTLTFAQR